MYSERLFLLVFISLISVPSFCQQGHELNTGWQCINIDSIQADGYALSAPGADLSHSLPATVPGTVLTTLLNNQLVPDPFYGMNNERIPDIYITGPRYYTYWFINDFTETALHGDEQVWLHLRGVNYSCDVFLNGNKLNKTPHTGMFLRQRYNITPFLSHDGRNRLAVLVHPAEPVGNANGGQGGDGEVAHAVAHQYVAGWDWIQPVRDRNTGIWDKVTIERTGAVTISNPHVVTHVPGIRQPGGAQQPARIKLSTELSNATDMPRAGVVQYELGGKTVTKDVIVPAHAGITVQLPDLLLANPRLWWPAGYGESYLYLLHLQFFDKTKKISDQTTVHVGIREIQTSWNAATGSRQVAVNGQKIFIKGGNWIISDAMLRFSPERYDAEIRFHRDMNLNLIRVWGGAITERPEFYDACDKYGLLVFQDFWNSGDCNGKWLDPKKKADQWIRRNYPDDHGLFLASVADQVKLLRNHASLAFWCGGNEITPPADILTVMKDSLLPQLDGTRYLFDYSNSDSMSHNFLGGNGDGPYGIQPVESFWTDRTYPFNSEVGSVGIGDYESLERFIPAANMVIPESIPGKTDSVWEYHKYIGYEGAVNKYGKPADIRAFADRAQLVNYDQYRSMAEGFSAHAWEWYTGFIIWKTQNPWTALRGQMYDYYLDPNACLYGLHSGSEPLHIMYDPGGTGMVSIVNNGFGYRRDLMMEIKTYDMSGRSNLLTQVFVEADPTSVKKYVPIKETVDKLRAKQGLFLSLRLKDVHQNIVSDNLYWLPDSTGYYSGLQQIKPVAPVVKARNTGGHIEVTISNAAGNPVAFFNRVSLVDSGTKKRVLPAFYSDNYVSVLSGEEKKVYIDYNGAKELKTMMVSLYGWNAAAQYTTIIFAGNH